MRGKPPAYSANCENGLKAELHYVPASMSRDIENLFDKSNNSLLDNFLLRNDSW